MNNNREQILLVVFLSALLIGGGVVGGSAAARHLQGQQKILNQKKVQLAEAKQWVEEKPMWEERGRWLSAHPLPVYGGQGTEAAFVQEIQGSVAKQGLQILDQRMQESASSRAFVEASVDLVVQGSLENTVRWLHEIRKADSYCLIRQVRFAADPQTATMKMEVSLARFYAAK
jgi:hypothetical protein